MLPCRPGVEEAAPGERLPQAVPHVGGGKPPSASAAPHKDRLGHSLWVYEPNSCSWPHTQMQPVLQDQAYALLPEGAPGAACFQRVEVVQDGLSCGSLDFSISTGTCDTLAIRVGKDGTVMQ